MTTEVSSPYLDMWKDWQPEVRLYEKDAATRQWKPAAGLLGVTFRVSLTEQGAVIGTLTGIATSEALGDDGLGGIYFAGVDLATLTAQMPEANPAFAHDEDVFLQVYKAGDIQVEAIRKKIRRYRYS